MSSETSVLTVTSSNSFNKTMAVPTSKSRANRYLICAALYPGEVVVENAPESTDVLKMIEILKKMNLDIIQEGSTVTISNSFPECEEETEEPIRLDTGDGGTTNRFLISLLSLGRNTYDLWPEGKIRSRPIKDLTLPLTDLGVDFYPGTKKTFWMSVTGPAFPKEGQKVSLDCEKSSQFASSLYMALHKTNVEIDYINLENSAVYFEMTRSIVNEFKKGKRKFVVPIDFSGVGYPLAMAAHHGEVHITNYSEIDPFQPDSVMLSILQKAGAEVKMSSNGLTVKNNGTLKGLEIDCRQYPDLVPTLAYLFAYAEGKTELKNLSTLAHKESNRIDEILKLCQLFKIEAKYNDIIDVMTIQGNPERHLGDEVHYDAPEDHRMIMVAYMFMKHNNGGTISNSHHVKKSFPGFFELMDC
jgi:3-phosphoshikimate 1-carboxyvinyltransferase